MIMGSRSVDCRKFSPNIFNKSKCSHCFRQREEHSAAALECNRASRKVSKCGYLFVAPDWDFSNPLYRTKRWQRRWFVLYDDGELTYSVDEHPETVPQAIVDMSKVLEVSTAEDVTGHLNSIAITAPERVTFVKGTCPEEAKWWLNILSAFPKIKGGRHKRNATFPGGQATTIIQPQTPPTTGRSRHNSYHNDTSLASNTTDSLIKDNCKINTTAMDANKDTNKITTNEENNMNQINKEAVSRVYNDQPASSKSPPTRDKLHPEGKAQVRNRNRNRLSAGTQVEQQQQQEQEQQELQQQQQQLQDNKNDANDAASECLLIEDAIRDEKLKDIANAITNMSNNRCWNKQTTLDDDVNVIDVNVVDDDEEQPTRDENYIDNDYITKLQLHQRPQTLSIQKTTAPSIVSAIIKKLPPTKKQLQQQDVVIDLSSLKKQKTLQPQPENERGDPDGGCNADDIPVNYLITKNSELRVNLPAEDLLHTKKSWLMKQDNRTGDWTKHWFTLRGAALFYYRDPIAEERGVLDGVLDVNSITNISECPVPRNFGFLLTTWDNNRIVLSTITANKRYNWINVLKSAAGLPQLSSNKTNEKLLIETNNLIQIIDAGNEKQKKQQTLDKTVTATTQPLCAINTTLIIKNTTDDIKKELEKDFITAQHGQEIIINNMMINDSLNDVNNNNGSKKPISVTPLTPKIMLFSSDEEYRTASEGGRRDSVDWGSPMSPLPTVPLSFVRTKDRIRSRSNSRSRLHKRSRSSPPSSRRSTIDSIGSDDLSIIQSVPEEFSLDKELQLRLSTAEKESNMLREEANEREARMSELLATFERTEAELKTRIREMEEARDNLVTQLNRNRISAQDLVETLTLELDDTKLLVKDLEEKLARGIEENETLYKKIHDVEVTSSSSLNSGSLNRCRMRRVDSLSDLTNLNEIDPFSMDRNQIADEYCELKSRFEKAVHEIRAMKKELKDSQKEFDTLEIAHAALRQDLERQRAEDESQIAMMAARIQDLTLKYSAADKQVRALKQKLAKSEKRRSLSLKGKETLSIQKELEEKVVELENKIYYIENKEQMPERESPTRSESMATDEKSLRRVSARLRRKSLDSCCTEPMQVLLRLNSLEKRLENVKESSAASNKQNNSLCGNNVSQIRSVSTSPKLADHLIERLRSLEGVVISSRDRIEQSLQQLQGLKASKSRRSVSPITDRKDSFRFLERYLSEAAKILRDSCEHCVVEDRSLSSTVSSNIIILPETNPVKLALTQLEAQLRMKLGDLLKQRRMLRERNELNPQKDMELLAERIAFESVCFGKLRDAVSRAENPTKLNERQMLAEVAETAQLMALLKAKLSGRCAVKPSGSIDLLASVLARRLVLTVGRSGQRRVSTLAPISADVMEELLRQLNELNLIALRYKNNAMENLACGLAAETLSYISSNDAVQGAVQEAWRQAQEAVNAELVQSEIAHIMTRNAQRFESSLAPAFGYTLTASERVNFENFADAVQDTLRREMELAIIQLTQCYEDNLEKMKRGQWRLHLDQERKASEGRQLLAEFADVIAHKALVDARIAVLRGDYTAATRDVQMEGINDEEMQCYSVVALQRYEILFAELASDMQLANPDDILAEADFNFMCKHYATEFATNHVEVREVSNSLSKLEQSLSNLQRTLNPISNNTTTPVAVDSLRSVCLKCTEIQDRVESMMTFARLLQAPCDQCNKMHSNIVQLTDQHESELKDLRRVHEEDVSVLSQQLMEQTKLANMFEIDHSSTNERLSNEINLLRMREKELIITVDKYQEQELILRVKERQCQELEETLKEERDNSRVHIENLEDLSDAYKRLLEKCKSLELERDSASEQLEKERERARKMEKRLEVLESEYAQQIENLHSSYRDQMLNNFDSEKNKYEDDSFRQRYQAEIEQLRTLCEKGLAAMESSHRRIINDLEDKHRQETTQLLCEKEQALAEETQATLAALDAMRKAHQSEVQREVARFKQEFIKQFQQKGGQTIVGHKEKEQELEEVRQEILSLSEKYSFKCVETSTLEDKLRITTQKLRHVQQQIQQLEIRNKQLRAHLVSEDSEHNSLNFAMSLQDVTSNNSMHADVRNTIVKKYSNVDKAITTSVIIATPTTATTTTTASNLSTLTTSSKEHSLLLLQKTKEIHPRLKFNEGTKLSPILATKLFSTATSHNLSKIQQQLQPVGIMKNNNTNLCLNTNYHPALSDELYDSIPASTSTSTATTALTDINQINNIIDNNFLNGNILNSQKKIKKLCSPPPLDGKDAEQQIRRFELEI